jgi:uncharacterized membrane protein
MSNNTKRWYALTLAIILIDVIIFGWQATLWIIAMTGVFAISYLFGRSSMLRLLKWIKK